VWMGGLRAGRVRRGVGGQGRERAGQSRTSGAPCPCLASEARRVLGADKGGGYWVVQAGGAKRESLHKHTRKQDEPACAGFAPCCCAPHRPTGCWRSSCSVWSGGGAWSAVAEINMGGSQQNATNGGGWSGRRKASAGTSAGKTRKQQPRMSTSSQGLPPGLLFGPRTDPQAGRVQLEPLGLVQQLVTRCCSARLCPRRPRASAPRP
jgi:hypothetical protein